MRGKRMKHFLCWLFGHEAGDAGVEIVKTDICEPGAEPRKIEMRIVGMHCRRCGHLMYLAPKGVVSDPNRPKEEAT
jgi:hypothetical protein